MPMKLRTARCARRARDFGERLGLGPRFAERERLLDKDVVRNHLAHQRVERRRAEHTQHFALRGLVGPEMPAGEAVLVEELGEAGHTPADFA